MAHPSHRPTPETRAEAAKNAASPSKGGRPRIELSEDQITQVEALAAFLTQEQIADHLGIGARTFRDIVARDERVSAAYKKGRAKAVEAVARSLFDKALSGDTTCAIFYLKTQAGWRETARVEHSGADGGPIDTEDAAASARAKLLRMFQRQAEADDGDGDDDDA